LKKIIIAHALSIMLFVSLSSIVVGEEAAKQTSQNIGTTTANAESRDDWWRKLQWPESLCPRHGFEDDAGVKTYKMADGRELVEVVCFLGAYQGQQIYYLRAKNGGFTLLEFDQFESPNKGVLEPYRAAEVTGSVQMTAAGGQLKVFRKYRGIGDCGQLLTYSLEKEQPQLVEFRTRQCDDDVKKYIPPDKWRKTPVAALPKLKKTH